MLYQVLELVVLVTYVIKNLYKNSFHCAINSSSYSVAINVDTYTSMKMVYTTLGLCKPLLLDEQSNTLDLTE